VIAPLRLVVADDHPVFRDGLQQTLDDEPDIDVVAAVADGDAAVEAAVAQEADVVLMDLRMPGVGGIEATKLLQETCPAAKVLVLTSIVEDSQILAAVRAGAAGYLLKEASPEEVSESVRAVHRGEPLLHPDAASSPFYLMAPRWGLLPLVVLATFAAIIASQALISGAFSLTRQAIQLGYSPRLEILYTSEHHQGQIYIPQVNWTLMFCTLGLVLGFRSSSALAAAYGIAVTLTMLITTMLAYLVARGAWGVRRVVAGSIALFFFLIELSFFGANLLKVTHGGWFPLVVGAVVYTVLSTWKRGRALLASRMRERLYPFDQFLQDIEAYPPQRVTGTAVFMTSNLTGTPPTLLHNLQHNKVLHDRVILLTVVTSDIPYVASNKRTEVEALGHGFYRLTLRYGFMEEPDVPDALAQASVHGFKIDLNETTFFLGLETLLATRRPGLPLWRERLFVLIARNAVRANAFFKIPPERVVELGMQVEL